MVWKFDKNMMKVSVQKKYADQNSKKNNWLGGIQSDVGIEHTSIQWQVDSDNNTLASHKKLTV